MYVLSNEFMNTYLFLCMCIIRASPQICDLTAVVLSGVAIICVWIAVIAAAAAVVGSFCRTVEDSDEEVQP